MANLTERIMETIKEMSDTDLMYLWNDYAQDNAMYDDQVFPMEDFNEFYNSCDPVEIATRCFYGHDEWGNESSFNPNRDFFYLNGYGNPVSLSYIGWNGYTNEFMFPSINYGIERLIEDLIDGNFKTDNDDINELLEQ